MSGYTRTSKLRACLVCSYVQSPADFKRTGCPNCDFLDMVWVTQMKGNSDAVAEATSGQFDGIVALTQPTESWVARWQRIERCVKGLYAVRVSGRLSEAMQDDLAARGITYRPRDTLDE